jgi:hypothetical protein
LLSTQIHILNVFTRVLHLVNLCNKVSIAHQAKIFCSKSNDTAWSWMFQNITLIQYYLCNQNYIHSTIRVLVFINLQDKRDPCVGCVLQIGLTLAKIFLLRLQAFYLEWSTAKASMFPPLAGPFLEASVITSTNHR